jgi:hypothetical protein
VTIGTSARPPKAMRRTWLAVLERRIADGLEVAIAQAQRERALAEADRLEREADRIRRQAGVE